MEKNYHQVFQNHRWTLFLLLGIIAVVSGCSKKENPAYFLKGTWTGEGEMDVYVRSCESLLPSDTPNALERWVVTLKIDRTEDKEVSVDLNFSVASRMMLDSCEFMGNDYWTDALVYPASPYDKLPGMIAGDLLVINGEKSFQYFAANWKWV